MFFVFSVSVKTYQSPVSFLVFTALVFFVITFEMFEIIDWSRWRDVGGHLYNPFISMDEETKAWECRVIEAG